MLKPRLRIPRGAGLLRPASTTSCQSPLSCALAANAAAAPKLHQTQRRSMQTTPGPHHLPALTYDDKYSTEGIPGLYSPHGYNFAWTQYSQWCLDKLNERTAGQGYNDKSVKEIAIITSREAKSAAIFNYASMAHNNHFYFDSIAAHGGQDPYEHMPSDLRKLLERSFGSLETLQSEMLNTANAMFGPGFVWLVRQRNTYGWTSEPFRILTTYQAGSPYAQAHWRRQARDMNSEAGFDDRSGSVVRDYYNMMNKSNNRAQLHGSSGSAVDAQTNRPPGGADVIPVLCVNTWEHAWMFDWGIGGKTNFLGAWWNVIHWGKVAERAFAESGRQMSVNPDMGQSQRAAQV